MVSINHEVSILSPEMQGSSPSKGNLTAYLIREKEIDMEIKYK